MNDFNRNDRFGGNSSGRKDFSRPSFGGGHGFGGGFKGGFKGGAGKGFGPKEMFQATCASCGKSCEVPFRPNGKKPVYCTECFAKNGGPSASSSSQSSFASRGSSDRSSSYNKPECNCGSSDLKRQIEAINVKLDKIMQLVGDKTMVAKQPVAKQVEAPSNAGVVTEAKVSEVKKEKKPVVVAKVEAKMAKKAAKGKKK
jgi:CxxC-x17-CxxC domain-containing protein